MPQRDEIELKDRADRALRAGRPLEALPLYHKLLARVGVFEAGLYETWLDGALAAYRALGRQREVGYVLLGLRRFTEAQSCFPVKEAPLDWALCASMMGRHVDAARVLGEAGHPALAAVELEAGGNFAAARGEWERLLGHPRLRGAAYETALAHFNLGECLLRLKDEAAAERELTLTQTMLEELADDFEMRGERDRAADCYSILLRLGRDTASFENVAEGYLNLIRIFAADDQKFYVLQYYEDFLEYAVGKKELHAAATLAREAADYSLKTGLVFDRHYLRRAVELWAETARHNEAQGGPTDLSENALHAAIDAASSLGDMATVGKLYGEMAALPLAQKKRDRYTGLARRYAAARAVPAEDKPFPEHLRRPGAYQDIWREDLIEWELDGEPAPVLARLVVERQQTVGFQRQALRALLLCGEPRWSAADPDQAARLAETLGYVTVYSVLRPLERLYEHASAKVRGAVMKAVAQEFFPRSFGLIRKALADPAEEVRRAGVDALRAMKFRHALDPLMRIFRESPDALVRTTALHAIADVGSLESGLFLLEVLRHEAGDLRALARERLSRLVNEDLLPHLRQALDVEAGETRKALQDIVASHSASSAVTSP